MQTNRVQHNLSLRTHKHKQCVCVNFISASYITAWQINPQIVFLIVLTSWHLEPWRTNSQTSTPFKKRHLQLEEPSCLNLIAAVWSPAHNLPFLYVIGLHTHQWRLPLTLKPRVLNDCKSFKYYWWYFAAKLFSDKCYRSYTSFLED